MIRPSQQQLWYTSGTSSRLILALLVHLNLAWAGRPASAPRYNAKHIMLSSCSWLHHGLPPLSLQVMCGCIGLRSTPLSPGSLYTTSSSRIGRADSHDTVSTIMIERRAVHVFSSPMSLLFLDMTACSRPRVFGGEALSPPEPWNSCAGTYAPSV